MPADAARRGRRVRSPRATGRSRTRSSSARRSPRQDGIERTIVCIGSHDPAIDVLADFIARTWPGRRLSAANVGSFGALLTRKRGECHVGGCHLLDEETETYHLPYLGRVLDGAPAVLVHMAVRDQGLIVRPGNPSRVTSLADLARPDVRFVNRQRTTCSGPCARLWRRRREIEALGGYDVSRIGEVLAPV